jgi:hypothetical protein
MASNLPPGCRVSGIPGNRPEDAAEEAFWDALLTQAEEAGLLSGPRALPDSWSDPDSPLGKIITLARDLGAADGYGEGVSEGMIRCQPPEMDVEYSGPAKVIITYGPTLIELPNKRVFSAYVTKEVRPDPADETAS